MCILTKEREYFDDSKGIFAVCSTTKTNVGKDTPSFLIQRYFCTVHGYAQKVDHSNGYWNPKIKLEVTMHFSEMIKQQSFKKAVKYITMYGSFFFQIYLKVLSFQMLTLKLSLKNVWLPIIFVLDSNNRC